MEAVKCKYSSNKSDPLLKIKEKGEENNISPSSLKKSNRMALCVDLRNFSDPAFIYLKRSSQVNGHR